MTTENLSSFVLGSSPEVLQGLTSPALNVAVWHRQVPRSVRSTLFRWAIQRELKINTILQGPTFDPRELLDGLTARQAREWLHRDLSSLLRATAALGGSSSLHVFFGLVETNRCQKFHTDYVRLRTVATYVGPATQWLPDDAVRWEGLDETPDPDNDLQLVGDLSRMQEAQEGDVVMLKGLFFGGGHARAAVHRSPPILKQGKRRVVLIATAMHRSH